MYLNFEIGFSRNAAKRNRRIDQLEARGCQVGVIHINEEGGYYANVLVPADENGPTVSVD